VGVWWQQSELLVATFVPAQDGTKKKHVPGRPDGANTDVERVEGKKSNPISSSITL
jgi:hypothetical protein